MTLIFDVTLKDSKVNFHKRVHIVFKSTANTARTTRLDTKKIDLVCKSCCYAHGQKVKAEVKVRSINIRFGI